MSKSLIIVESPAKTKTLKNFLGSKFSIEATMGHIRDLPKNRLGVKIDNDFEPQYVSIPERRDVIKKLKESVKKADTVYLASDPDREGEAIAWHLQQALKLKEPKRVRFNSITEHAVKEGLANAEEIKVELVNAQQARRVLDRLVGYKLSPLLWKKVKRNLSAGRVQSVAVRLVVDREREIDAFVSEEYWTIEAMLSPKTEKHDFTAKLALVGDEKAEISDEKTAKEIENRLSGAVYTVRSVKKSDKKRNPPIPFITSTLQQEASRKLGYGAKKTMMIAQQLYEGIDLGDRGATGLITYMRTDSSRIDPEAQAQARSFITETFGKEYIPEKPRQIARKGAQDAHEAIRPTIVDLTPDAAKEYLSADQFKLYKLIWQRFIASQMSPAVFNVCSVEIEANEMLFRATGSTPKFQGFMKLYVEGKDDAKGLDDEEQPPLPELEKGQELDLKALNPEQHFTEPPPRFTEATLVRALEEKGIGRPSTYATILSTIQDRNYVELEKKRFKPTELGMLVTDQLVKHFPKIMDVKFTADIENQLDGVEEGDTDWIGLLKEFYGPFEKDLAEAGEKMENVKVQPELTDVDCPECGAKMVIRESRYGKFLGCSKYPECTAKMPIKKDLNIPCPKCEEGSIVEKKSKKGKVFYGCDKYPECDFVSWDKPTEKPCPKCTWPLGEKNQRGNMVGYKCTNPECDYKEDAPKKNDEDGDEAVA